MIRNKNKLISKNSKPIIIAEIAQSHLGSFSKIKKMIKMISKTGIDVIKFQTHYAEEESTLDEPFRKFISNKFKSRYDYWKKMEFSENQWIKIKACCEENNVLFLSSPFSIKAANLLKKIGLNFWKIGSGEFFSKDLIDHIIKFKDLIIISTGLSNLEEIKKIVKKFKKKKINFILLQCTSLYPSKLKEVGVNVLDDFKKKFKCLYGLSDHSGSIYPSIFALCKGAKVVEVHVDLYNKGHNPDKESSINLKQLETLCRARNEIYEMTVNKVNKGKLHKKLLRNKKIFTKSLALKYSLEKGSILNKENITFKKPGFGIPIDKKHLFIGKKLVKKVSHRKLLKITDVI